MNPAIDPAIPDKQRLSKKDGYNGFSKIAILLILI